MSFRARDELGRVGDSREILSALHGNQLGSHRLPSCFRVTLFSEQITQKTLPEWQARLMDFLKENNEISTKEATPLWKTSDRITRTRLRKLVNEGVLSEVGTGPKDLKKTYVPKRNLS